MSKRTMTRGGKCVVLDGDSDTQSCKKKTQRKHISEREMEAEMKAF